jgi:hypothetical protein
MIARFVQTDQCGWTKYALFGWRSSPKAVGFIKRAEWIYQKYFQLPLFSVLQALEPMTKEVPGIRPAMSS